MPEKICAVLKGGLAERLATTAGFGSIRVFVYKAPGI